MTQTLIRCVCVCFEGIQYFASSIHTHHDHNQEISMYSFFFFKFIFDHLFYLRRGSWWSPSDRSCSRWATARSPSLRTTPPGWRWWRTSAAEKRRRRSSRRASTGFPRTSFPMARGATPILSQSTIA